MSSIERTRSKRTTLLFHNISGGYDCAKMHTSYDIPKTSAIEKYAALYQPLQPDLAVFVEAHADIPATEDTHNGTAQSVMTEYLQQALMLPYAAVHAHSPSHINPKKSLGTAVLSKYPIKESRIQPLPNPQLVYEVSPGVVWRSHDRNIQKTVIREKDSEPVEIIVFHGFPFYKFGVPLFDPEHPEQYQSYREQVARILTERRKDMPTIIAGDFNNDGLVVAKAFPGLTNSGFTSAIEVQTTQPRFYPQTQFDHVFLSEELQVEKARVIHKTPSDHSLILVQFSRR
jgi:endonuclease/exonuclease/phosphatase family metal-dependent hydrolase